jgi:hypothetical protein
MGGWVTIPTGERQGLSGDRAPRGMLWLLASLLLVLVAVFATIQIGHHPQRPDLPATATPAPQGSRTEQALTVNLTGPNGWAEPDHLFVRAFVKGMPPDRTSTALLVSEDADNRATVTAVDAASCTGQPSRITVIGGTEWCLDVQGLRPGSTVTGVVAGQSTNLKLTLALRDHFLLVPLAVTVLALLLAVGVAGLGPDHLGRWLRARAVKKELEQNNVHPDRIGNLTDDWVDATTLDRSGNTLLRMIRDVRQFGPVRAREARERLRRRLEEPEQRLPSGHPLRMAALDEVNRSDHTITDFLDANAEPVTHPADKMIGTLDQFDALDLRINKLANHLDRTDGCDHQSKAKLHARLDEVRRFLATAGDASSIADVDDLADQLQSQIVEAAQPGASPSADALVAEMTAGQQTVMTPQRLPPAAPLLAGRAITGPRAPARTIRTGRWWPSFTEDLAIASAFLALMATAAISVAASDYFPTVTFGSTGDYLGLFAAALGTASASSILASLFLWKPSAQD